MLQMPYVDLTTHHLVMTSGGCLWSGLGYVIDLSLSYDHSFVFLVGVVAIVPSLCKWLLIIV